MVKLTVTYKLHVSVIRLPKL